MSLSPSSKCIESWQVMGSIMNDFHINYCALDWCILMIWVGSEINLKQWYYYLKQSGHDSKLPDRSRPLQLSRPHLPHLHTDQVPHQFPQCQKNHQERQVRYHPSNIYKMQLAAKIGPEGERFVLSTVLEHIEVRELKEKPQASPRVVFLAEVLKDYTQG